MFQDAFNQLLNLQGRSVALVRLSGPGGVKLTVNIKVAPSNYSRILAGPGSSSIEGFEFLLSADALRNVQFPTPLKKTDKIIDADLGSLSIEEVIPLYDLGGGIIGYRVRTG